MKTVFFMLIWLGMACPQIRAGNEDPQAHVWTISDGLKGTPAQLQHLVNGSVEDAWSRLADARAALAAKQDQMATESAAIIKAVHETQAYKDRLLQQKQAEAELAKARQNQDIASAMDFSSQANLAKLAIKKLEDTAMRNDAHLSQSKDFAAEYSHRVEDAEVSFKKAATWRSRIVHAVRFGSTLSWPVVEGQYCCFNYGKVVDHKDGQIQFESEAQELIPGTEQKNARGDGIGIATYKIHRIIVTIPAPAGSTPITGMILPIKGAYKIVGPVDETSGAAVYHAQPDPNGIFGTLLQELNTVNGPPKSEIDKIDDAVDLSEAKAMEELNKKQF